MAWIVFFLFSSLLGHQPIIVDERVTNVDDPEISKAYYAKLSGKPHIYNVFLDKPTSLYINLLIPDRKDQNRDVSAILYQIKKGRHEIAKLNGEKFAWKSFYEEFGADHYFIGPEFKKELSSGIYQIWVYSLQNNSRYVLVVGEKEQFQFKALNVIPKLKKDFFGTSNFTYLKSPLGIGYLLFLILAGIIVGIIIRLIFKGKRGKNIDIADRALRAILAYTLLILGINFWSPLMLFFSGFCIFEAIFSWCGLYAAIGKNSTPL